MIFIILNLILGIIGILAVFFGINYNKNPKDKISSVKLLPSEINYLHKDMTYMNRGILSTLLDLKRRKKLEITKYTRESRNKTLEDFVIEYEFKLLNKEGLKNHELLFLDNIFKDKTLVTTDELTQRAIDGQEFLKEQGNWVNEIEKELKNMDIISSSKKNESNKLKVLGLISIIIGIISLINNQFTGLIGIAAAMPILLVSINMGMEKSPEGRYLLNYYNELEREAKSGNIQSQSEEELIELLAITLTMKYFNPIYENSRDYETIDLVVDSINEYDGSYFDDAILRGFMGFTAKTRDDTLDTNRIDYRLFK